MKATAFYIAALVLLFAQAVVLSLLGATVVQAIIAGLFATVYGCLMTLSDRAQRHQPKAPPSF